MTILNRPRHSALTFFSEGPGANAHALEGF